MKVIEKPQKRRTRRSKKWQEQIFEPLKAKIKASFYELEGKAEGFAFGHGFLWVAIDTGDGLHTRTLLGSGCVRDWSSLERELKARHPELIYTDLNLD